MAIRMAVASMDEEYLRRLALVLEQYPQMDLSVYCNVDSIIESVGKERFDVFVFSSDIMNESLGCMNLQADLKLQLYDENDIRWEEAANIKYVKKYQRVSRIYRQILDYCAGLGEKSGILDASHTGVMAFYSPIGGAGKTTLALASAMKYAKRGKRTFYMSLEDTASESCFLGQDGKEGMSDLIGFLNSDKSFRMKIEKMIKQKSENFYYINHFSSPNDIYEMNVEDVRELVQALKKSGLFDILIIDMGTGLDEKNCALFGMADKVAVVEKLDEMSVGKMDCFYKQQHIMSEYSSKMAGVVNFYNGAASQHQSPFPMLGRVGDIENLDSTNIIETLAESPKTDFLAAVLSN